MVCHRLPQVPVNRGGGRGYTRSTDTPASASTNIVWTTTSTLPPSGRACVITSWGYTLPIRPIVYLYNASTRCPTTHASTALTEPTHNILTAPVRWQHCSSRPHFP